MNKFEKNKKNLEIRARDFNFSKDSTVYELRKVIKAAETVCRMYEIDGKAITPSALVISRNDSGTLSYKLEYIEHIDNSNPKNRVNFYSEARMEKLVMKYAIK